MRRTTPQPDPNKLQEENGKVCLDTRLMQGNNMKTFVLILVMFATPLAAQNKQSQNTAPPQTAAQSASGQAAQHPQTVAKSVVKPAQPHSPQQPITFTAKQLDEYEDKILDRSETFYNNRMTVLLWTMGILVGIGAVIIPLVISGFIQWQRKISFTKELAQTDANILEFTKEQIKELEKKLISPIDDRETKQIIAVSSNLSMLYAAIGGLSSSQKSQAGYDLMLQIHVLAMKYFIIGQCSGGSLPANQIIQFFSQPHIANKLTLETLKAVDAEIEDMKGDLGKIVDAEKRVDMESQVKDLQIFVNALIHEKRK